MGELILTIGAHAFVGIGLAAFVWALGTGWLELVRRGDDAFAYPVGLLVAIVAAWLALVSAWLAPLSVLLLAPALLGLRLPWRPLGQAAPFALGLGLALGGLLHGPTEEESSHAYGDLLFYAAKLVSARESVLPFRDLLVAGESSTYVEAGSTFLGAALPVDPVLFQAATMPAFVVAALALGFGVLGTRGAWVLAPLALAVVAYPTWITESPPVALALPLAFPLYRLATSISTAAGVGAAVAVLGPAFALTKGFGAVLLAVAAAFALHRVRIDRATLVRYGMPALALAAAGTAYVLATSAWLFEVLDAKFLPADALDGLLDQVDRRDTQSASRPFLVAGELLLLAAFARARAWPHTAVAAVAVAGNWFLGGHGFDVAVGIAVVFALVLFAPRPDPLVLAAGAALAVSCVFRDISGVHAGLVFGLLLAGGVVAAIVPLRQTLAVGAAVAVGVAAGYARGPLAEGPATLTPADYAAWRAVERRAGRDDLVFTSETGPALGDSRQGWNYYPGVAGRQVYLAGWSSSPLLVDDDERARRLRLNADVLAGRRGPGEVAPGYQRYFGVVRRGDRFILYVLP